MYLISLCVGLAFLGAAVASQDYVVDNLISDRSTYNRVGLVIMYALLYVSGVLLVVIGIVNLIL